VTLLAVVMVVSALMNDETFLVDDCGGVAFDDVSSMMMRPRERRNRRQHCAHHKNCHY
jgi:hypothetical protein